MTAACVHKEQGFTLAEVLVGLAITGLGAVLFAAVIGTIGLTTRHAAQDEAERDPVRDAQFLLADRIARMRPVIDAQTASSIDMAGRGDSLDFIAEDTGTGAPDALQRFRIARDPAGGLALYQLSTLDTATDPRARETSHWRKFALLDRATALSFGYFGPDPVSHVAAWQREWTHRGGLPLLVRVSVQFSDDDGRRWPDLFVRPRAATGDTCERIARTGLCKGDV